MSDPHSALAWDPLDALVDQVRAQLENAATRRGLTAPPHSRTIYACTKLGALDQLGYLTSEGRALLDALRAGRPVHIPDQPAPWLAGTAAGKVGQPAGETGDAAKPRTPKSKAVPTPRPAASTSTISPRFRVSEPPARGTRAATVPAAQTSFFD